MENGYHQLKEIDEKNRSAICVVCGFAKIHIRKKYKSGKIKWECNGKTAQRNKKRSIRIFQFSKTKRICLPVGTYERLFEQQGGKCGICGRTENYPFPRFFFDHDHLTGKIRGLLCNLCNTKMGVLDNKEWIEKALKFLEG